MKRTPREPVRPRPVERVELDTGRQRSRLLLLIFAVAAAVAAFSYCLYSLLGGENGWQTIEPDSSKMGIGSELVLTCRVQGTADRKKLTVLYSELSPRLYQAFSADEPFEGSVYALNHSGGEETVLDPALYAALKNCDENGSRMIFLGPVWADYASLFASKSDEEAYPFNPKENPDQAAWIAEAMTFAADPAHIRLELCCGNRARLIISDEYRAWAAENGTDRFIDFFMLKNAFYTDALADALEKAGYTEYSVSSRDGFVRVSGDSKDRFGMKLYRRGADTAVSAGEITLEAPAARVFLSEYPIGLTRYFRTSDSGKLLSPWIDMNTGLPACAWPEASFSRKGSSCVSLLLSALPVYTGTASPETLGEDTSLLVYTGETWARP